MIEGADTSKLLEEAAIRQAANRKKKKIVKIKTEDLPSDIVNIIKLEGQGIQSDPLNMSEEDQVANNEPFSYLLEDSSFEESELQTILDEQSETETNFDEQSELKTNFDEEAEGK